MKCLILAGGFGTRLYPVTIDRAKALLEYKGRPLITHIVQKIPQDIDIMVSCNRKFEHDFYRWRDVINREIDICVEEVWIDEQKKGAIGSLNFWVKSRNISEDLLVIASDNYFEFDITQFIDAYNGTNALVAVYDIADKSKATNFGVVRLNKDRIIELDEKPARPKSSLIATAIYILPPRIFPLLSGYCSEGNRDNLGSFIAYLVDKDRVNAYAFTELWVDVGSRDELV